MVIGSVDKIPISNLRSHICKAYLEIPTGSKLDVNAVLSEGERRIVEY